MTENKHVKDKSQDWFDAEIMEKLTERYKLRKKFKKTCQHVNKYNNNKAWNEVQKLICKKKKAKLEKKTG